jgi:hypothetical protein
MQGKSKQEHPELLSFKHMALWLLAYKLYRDYFEVIKFGRAQEPEKFFEDWASQYAPSMYSNEEKNCIWHLFLKLLMARMAYPG